MVKGTLREESSGRDGAADGDGHHHPGSRRRRGERGWLPADLFPARLNSGVLWRSGVGVFASRAFLRPANGEGLRGGGGVSTVFSAYAGGDLSPGAMIGGLDFGRPAR